MSHANYVKVNVKDLLSSTPLEPSKALRTFAIVALIVGIVVALYGFFVAEPEHFWGVFYVNVLFWNGLAFGGLVTTLIFQIVRAKWAGTIRRIAEANISFVPITLGLLLFTYLGREHIFPWATTPMPGREWWMQPNFVYARFVPLFIFLYVLFRIYVNISLRTDAGYIKEDGRYTENWNKFVKKFLPKSWASSESEVKNAQVKLSYLAPLIVFIYVIVYSLFSFEMIMGTDKVWFSNMFGGFNFIGNVSMGWAMLALTIIFLSSTDEKFARVVNKDQLWDLGKLQFGFTMLWGYLFFSQYLPQWYGNMPEETAWMLTRARGTWMPLSYFVFSCCFVIPFVMLLSEDVKKTRWTYVAVICVILTGYWFEKYVVLMPQMYPDSIPFLENGFVLEFGLFAGFLGAYILCIQNFLKKHHYVAVSHPLTYSSTDW